MTSSARVAPKHLQPPHMFWKNRSIRHADDSSGELEAALGSSPGLGRVKLAGSSLKNSAGKAPGIVESMVRKDGGHGSGPDPGPEGDFEPETGISAQPSDENRVPEGMATMVLDKSALGTGSMAHVEVAGLRSKLDPASDAAIMLRVAAGDESAFTFLVGKHNRPLIHFLYRMVHNQAVAEELAQEVFLRVYRARDSYRAEARFTTWLYRIATNLAVNLARDTRHERSAQTVYLDAPDEETGTTPDVADDEPSVEQRLLKDERMAAIRNHVMALPERQRMAVLMHKYQGMDYRQIGDVLKLSESATKSLLFRAYQTLRERLKDFV